MLLGCRCRTSLDSCAARLPNVEIACPVPGGSFSVGSAIEMLCVNAGARKKSDHGCRDGRGSCVFQASREKVMTRQIIVTQYVSLDGVIEDPVGMENSGLGNWTGPFSRGPEGDRFKHEELQAADSLIFGRTTYEAFAAAWPHMKDETGFADRMNTLPKIVASSTLKNPSWGETAVWNGDIVSAATVFRAQGNGAALIYGSASVVHQLAAAGLVDEYRLMVLPTILGRGKRLYADGVKSNLKLVENRQLGGGIVLLRYKPA
jgi:dihydrofolate reductase